MMGRLGGKGSGDRVSQARVFCLGQARRDERTSGAVKAIACGAAAKSGTQATPAHGTLVP